MLGFRAILTSAVILWVAALSDAETRPNVVLILIDDMGWGDFSCFGNAAAKTPHIDRLAKEGMVFEQFYVNSPICSPSRVAISTGTRNQETVFSAMDLVPSLMKLGGAIRPTSLDGEDMHQVLLGKSKDPRKQPLFFSCPPDRKNYYGLENLPDLAMREGQWKLLCDYDGSRPLLYDLSKDPGEANDLTENHKDRVLAMSKRLVEWYCKVTPE